MGRPKCTAWEKAVNSGQTTYNTGKPCRKGHFSDRWVGDRSCRECRVENNRQTYAAKSEEINFRRRARREPKTRILLTEEERLERRRKNAARQRDRDPEGYIAKNNAATRRYAKANPKKRLVLRRLREEAVRQRTPVWADREAIKRFYEACPVGYEVDHEIPLRGRFVSGLHVVENLQYLTSEANRRKSNRA